MAWNDNAYTLEADRLMHDPQEYTPWGRCARCDADIEYDECDYWQGRLVCYECLDELENGAGWDDV